MEPAQPTPDDLDDVLLACRYGDLDDVLAFSARFGDTALTAARDASDNTPAHMAAANGHTELLEFILARTPGLAAARNAAGSTPLHWAALNQHLAAAQRLVATAGAPLIDTKNAAGRTPLGEAELAGWEEGAQWMVGAMTLDGEGKGAEGEEEGEETVSGVDVEVEIQDADGRVARMTLGSDEPAHEVAGSGEAS
ncbi:ankyrin repeat-containing domain protein [Vararia minispora EC-137]|uniref:Ankyrin repeat-containing domain protein n=1 Tax=Vararia minispora EC-137 TaxID=1314806 RepID=A0ACB8QJY8_9AGAM|nr:ankyrin repeat-containing domain protein [Vararia minispora EC-137]